MREGRFECREEEEEEEEEEGKHCIVKEGNEERRVQRGKGRKGKEEVGWINNEMKGKETEELALIN